MRYSASAGEAPIAALKAAMLEYPRAIVTRDLLDKELAGKLVELANEQQSCVLICIASHVVPKQVRTSRRCITHALASSHQKWNTSLFAKIFVAKSI
jgi:hypothetical protein